MDSPIRAAKATSLPHDGGAAGEFLSLAEAGKAAPSPRAALLLQPSAMRLRYLVR